MLRPRLRFTWRGRRDAVGNKCLELADGGGAQEPDASLPTIDLTLLAGALGPCVARCASEAHNHRNAEATYDWFHLSIPTDAGAKIVRPLVDLSDRFERVR
jgi:hypothetical protein